MSRSTIRSDKAPAAVGPYSLGVRAGDLVFLSGQVALIPAEGRLLDGDVEAQTRQVFANVAAAAEAAGGSLASIVKLTLYLADIDDFQAVNAVMREIFTEPYPARAAVGVAALPLGAKVEADAILYLG